MSAIELLKQGIESNDWPLVCEAYQVFTGNKLECPEKREVPHTCPSLLISIKDMIDEYLFSCNIKSSKEEIEPVEVLQKPVKVNETTEKKPEKPDKGYVDKTKPAWVDDGTIANNDIAHSQLFSKHRQPEPRREPEPKLSVTCFKCGTTKTVPAIFGPRKLDKNDTTNYVCDRCISKPGQ
jgi:DNA-directed RNA polymerase subunit M/transcription elongation factor TFIIS